MSDTIRYRIVTGMSPDLRGGARCPGAMDARPAQARAPGRASQKRTGLLRIA